MRRRKFFKVGAGSLIASMAAPVLGFPGISVKPNTNSSFQDSTDIIVVGAGVFGLWTAFNLQQMGAKVTLIDAYGPGNSRATSGGESRILRSEYGDRLMYTKMNIRAHELWDKWQQEWNRNLMYSTGRLTMGDRNYKAVALKSKETLVRFGITSEVLDHDELKYRWPQINVEGIEAGLYFAGGAGGSTLMARESCQVVGNAFTKAGGKLKIGKVTPGLSLSNKMQNINLDNGEKAEAQTYIFACGPWMGKLFPEIFAEKLKVYRRDVLFVGPAPGDDRYSYPNFPVWSFSNTRYYGMPDIRGRGLKVAPWPDYNSIDMDNDDRIVNSYEVKRIHEFVAHRFPGLKDQPILESRVCQLTLSTDQHFIIDKHPEMDNVWFVCAGSGHGFKHGPALGEYVANRILKNKLDPEYDEAFRLKDGTF